MIRAFFALLSVCLALGACTQRMICPAYQSAFIYDKDALRKKFSYFQEDSTPKILTASKNKYLIAESVSYRKKLGGLQTIEMRDINPVIPDSLTEDGDISMAEMELATQSVIDSTFIVDVEQQPVDSAQLIDSAYVITKDREVRTLRFNADSISYKVEDIRYNTDQDNYMWYLRKSIVLPDVRIAQNAGKEQEEESTRKKGIKGFFKNLFKKKKRDQAEMPSDSTLLEPEQERSEFDFDYEDLDAQPTDSTQVGDEQVEKKKGPLSFLKKNKAAKKEKKSKVKDNAPAESKPAKTKKEKKNKREDVKEEEGDTGEEPETDDGGF